jgi:hypothetical protein
MDKSLKLSEKLFCLAVNPKKGGIYLNATAAITMTLTGSVFAELKQKGLVFIDRGMVHLVNPTIQSDEILEFFLNRLRLRNKDRRMRTWLTYFHTRGRKIRKLFIRNLLHKNVLRMEERRILFIPYKKVFLNNPELIENIRKDVKNTLLGTSVMSDDLLTLARMATKTNLLQRIFPDNVRRKIAVRNLKKLPETEISKAVHEAIEMVHDNVFATVT